MTRLHDMLVDLPGPDEASAVAVHERAADILRPSGALAWLDELAEWIAGWHRTDHPIVAKPVGLIFAGDHGVAAAEAVSAYPTERHGGDVRRLPPGPLDDQRVRPPRSAPPSTPSTSASAGRRSDIRFEAAMTVDALRRDRGHRRAPPSTGSTATSSSSARWASATPRRRPPSPPRWPAARRRPWVGRGTGVDDAGLDRKRVAVAAGRATASPASPTRSRCCARSAAPSWPPSPPPSSPPATVRCPCCSTATWSRRRCCRSSCATRPRSTTASSATARPSPATATLLERLGKRPLLDLDMRLGEGSGAMAAVPLVAMACAGITEVPTFAEWFGEQ